MSLTFVNPGQDALQAHTLASLQAMNMPLTILSGYRDPEYNRRVGGAPQSRHVHGDAVDISMAGMSDAERIALIEDLRSKGFRRFGAYSKSPDMLHADMSPAQGDVHFMFDRTARNMDKAPAWFHAAREGSSVQTFPSQAPGMPPAPPEQSQMMPLAPYPQLRPTDRFSDIFDRLQGRPGLGNLAQALFAMGDVLAPPGQQTGAAAGYVMGGDETLATQLRLARLMQEEERLVDAQAARAQEAAAIDALASSISNPTIAAAVRAGVNPKTLGLIEETPLVSINQGSIPGGGIEVVDESGIPTIKYKPGSKREIELSDQLRQAKLATRNVRDLRDTIAKIGGEVFGEEAGRLANLYGDVSTAERLAKEMGAPQAAELAELATQLPDPRTLWAAGSGEIYRIKARGAYNRMVEKMEEFEQYVQGRYDREVLGAKSTRKEENSDNDPLGLLR